MKITVAVVAALLCLALASPPNYAQAKDAPSVRAAEISLHFENAEVAEIAQAIADQGKVQLVLEDVKVKVKLFHLDKSTPEAALEKLAQETDLLFKKIDGNNYFLGNKPLEPVKIVEVAKVIEKAKPYTIKFRFNDALTQEIRVKENDEFGISTTIGDTKWTVKGVNMRDETGMTVHLQLERMQGKSANSVTSETMRTVMHTPADGKEIVLGETVVNGKNSVLSMSVHKNAP